MRHFLLPLIFSAACLLAACGGGTPEVSDEPDAAVNPDGGEPDGDLALEDGGDGGEDAGVDAGADAGADEPVETSCDFPYDDWFGPPPPLPLAGPESWRGPGPEPPPGVVDAIAWGEPLPPSVSWLLLPAPAPGGDKAIVFPDYDDDMPLFERATDWGGGTRCYETPLGVRHLSEDEAYELWRGIAEGTTGVKFDATPGRRSVVGLRGAYPGTFAWHGNRPDRFNDTLVLLWVDGAGARRVKEFPVNTDTGTHDFGGDNTSSSLRPNRRYRYINGWHRSYNALQIDLSGYRVRDDHNHNGHWDSDRNGWLPPAGDDHDRTGSGHNIHMGSLDAPLGTAVVGVWSAGCQVIPGMANWREFITNAWTTEGDPVDYFLVDSRDIPPELWWPCTPDGTHACPFVISGFPFSDSRTTAGLPTRDFEVYNCSTADEAGPEVVYVFTVDSGGLLTVSVDCPAGVDIDIHLLDGDDPRACLARDDTDFAYDLSPGRYWIVADTYVAAGAELVGEYTLHLTLE